MTRTERDESEASSGLTWRSTLGIFYAIIVFMPAIIWTYLVTGSAAIGGAVTWASLLLFVELSWLSGNPLTKQEGVVIFLTAGVANLVPATGLLYAIYYRNSPIAASFGLTDSIPSWYAPVSKDVYFNRALFDPSWLQPMAVMILGIALNTIVNLSLAFFARQMFIVEEKLPFPLATVQATAVNVLAERESDRMTVFSLSALFGVFYSLFLYGFPFVASALGYEFSMIPYPWFDLSYYVQLVAPGSSFGFATDLSPFAIGLIIPFSVTVSLFLGSFFVYFVGNFTLVSLGLTRFAKEWTQGMPLQMSWERSLLYFWAWPIIGLGIAAGVTPLIRNPSILIRTFRGLRSTGSAGKVPLWWTLIGFVGGASASVVMVRFLAPGFPIWIAAVLSIGWSFISVIVSVRAIGRTGVGISIPYIHNLLILASGYSGVDMWFVPAITSDGAITWTSSFKVAEINKCTSTSIVKAWLLALPIAVLVSFLYMANFWSMAPIPSAIYPGVNAFWPVQATWQSLWITRRLATADPSPLLYAFLAGCGLYLVTDILHLPISLIGLATGAASPLPVPASILIGSVGGLITGRILGRDWYEKNRSVMSSGLIAGSGIIVVVASSIATIIKSTWALPY